MLRRTIGKIKGIIPPTRGEILKSGISVEEYNKRKTYSDVRQLNRNIRAVNRLNRVIDNGHAVIDVIGAGGKKYEALQVAAFDIPEKEYKKKYGTITKILDEHDLYIDQTDPIGGKRDVYIHPKLGKKPKHETVRFRL